MTPAAPWRVVIVTRILPVVLGFYGALREAGHEPVALLTVRDNDGRYGGFELGGMLGDVPGELEVVMPARRSSIAPLLRALEPDLVVCTGFPWKIPADALGVPPLGWLNGHPSLLPRHRGPVPVAWSIRNGEPEIGITFHRMDTELDTGAILAQRTMTVGEYCEPDEFYGRMGPLHIEAFGEALAKLAAGDEGTPQAAGGEYESFFARRGRRPRPLAQRRRGAPPGLGLALHDPRRHARTARCSSSTARPCACSRRRSSRSRARDASSAPTRRSGS